MLPERAGPRRAALRRTHCAVVARVQAARLEALLTRAPSEDGCASVLRRAAREGGPPPPPLVLSGHAASLTPY